MKLIWKCDECSTRCKLVFDDDMVKPTNCPYRKVFEDNPHKKYFPVPTCKWVEEWVEAEKKKVEE